MSTADAADLRRATRWHPGEQRGRTLKVCTILALTASASTARAGDVQTTQEFVTFTMESSLRLCDIVKAEGSTQSTKVTGEVKATLSGLLKKLSDLGGSVSSSMETGNYQGIRQEDLAPALSNVLACRERTFATLMAMYRIPAPQPSKPAPGSPNRGALQLQPVAAPGRPGWMKDSRTGCHIWNPAPLAGETITWSGGCSGGKASGEGTVEANSVSAHEIASGTMVDGRLQGQATFIDQSNGQTMKMTGPARDGSPVRGFFTVWNQTANGNLQFSGDWDPQDPQLRFFGAVSMIGEQFRYEGPLDDQHAPHGRGIFTERGGPAVAVDFNHGFTFVSPQRWVCVNASVPCPPR